MSISRSNSSYYLNNFITHSAEQFYGYNLFDIKLEDVRANLQDIDIQSSQSIEFDDKMDYEINNRVDSIEVLSNVFMEPIFVNTGYEIDRVNALNENIQRDLMYSGIECQRERLVVPAFYHQLNQEAKNQFNSFMNYQKFYN
ncbi:unnamed protein product [Brachionus calyciflorus]|uniref:Uncharacterized protein n=1 Tax=Brachionus calyciflorus TaxID=104777 RepID=A0A813VR27_9BILA|nr:unnamed protein product [Brachionus calyciflorus]